MKQPALLVPSAVLVALAGSARGQEASWFLGPPGGVGEVAVFDRTTGRRLAAPEALQGIQLVPLDCAGRTALDALAPSAPRLQSDVPGVTRIALPHENGSLYRFRRADASDAVYGHLWVDPQGVPHALVERPATASGADPWLAKVAIAPDGSAFLAATAAGELVEVELASGVTQSRGVAAGVAPNGLRLLDEWGVVATAGALLRFDRAPGASVAAVPFPSGAPAFLGDGVVASADGKCAAVIAGASPALVHVWMLERTGPAAQVSQTAMALSGAGFLPEHSDGPYLALSPQASACLWRSQGASAEAWVRRTQLAAPPPVQVTADATFLDTLDSTGEFGFFDELTAFVLVGESDPAGVEGADVYRVDVDPLSGATTVANLSLTSGVASPPFEKGELEAGGVLRIEGAPGLLVHVDLPSDEGLLGVVRPGRPGLTVLRDGVASIDAVAPAGAHVALAVRDRDQASELLSLPLALDGITVHASLPRGFAIAALAGEPRGLLGVLLDVPGGRWIGRVDLLAASAEVLAEVALPLGATIAWQTSRLAFSVDWDATRSLGVEWGGARTLGLFATGGVPCHPLP